MKTIKIADTTLCRESTDLSFKEKLEIARQLEKLNIDVIEFPEIKDAKTDILFVKTASSFVENSMISVAAGVAPDSIDNAIAALSAAKKPCIRIEVPLSPVGMEYTCHKKPAKMLEWISEAVKRAKDSCGFVEFCALDATRTEKDFLKSALMAANTAGADIIAVCDSAAEKLPDDFADFISSIKEYVSAPISVGCANQNGLACANAVMAIKSGAECIKTAVGTNAAPLDTFADIIRNCGNSYGFTSNIKQTELHRTVKQISWITDSAREEKSAVTVVDNDAAGIQLDLNDTREAVISAVCKLGYDLSEEDQGRVYEEFQRVARKKRVGAKELEAIVATSALQVPSTYKLVNYVINSGNIISASAQITLVKDGEEMKGASIGNGPIDAAFLTIDQIIGHHYELDDFQIQSITEGREAMGSAIVKLRSGGKLYCGNGISTDIIGSSIRAYINAVNKIVYEEAQEQ